MMKIFHHMPSLHSCNWLFNMHSRCKMKKQCLTKNLPLVALFLLLALTVSYYFLLQVITCIIRVTVLLAKVSNFSLSLSLSLSPSCFLVFLYWLSLLELLLLKFAEMSHWVSCSLVYTASHQGWLMFHQWCNRMLLLLLLPLLRWMQEEIKRE